MPAAATARSPRPPPRRQARLHAVPRQRAKPRVRTNPSVPVVKGPRMTIYRSHSARSVAHNAAGMIPIAAGRTAVAMRELPDSSAIVRLTRGRLWIGLLSVLLTGIVALNLLSLSLSSSAGRVGEQITQLQQENSALRGDIAEKLSSTKVQAEAPALGLSTVGTSQITYLSYSPADIARAARGLAGRLVALAGTALGPTQAGQGGSTGVGTTSGAGNAASGPTQSAGPASSAQGSPAPAAPAAATPHPSQSGSSSGAGGARGGGVSAGL